LNRLFIDFKENHKGEITGPIKFPADSVFVLEALAIAVKQFSLSCEVPAGEIVKDLGRLCE